MTVSLEVLQHHIDYTIWASQRLLNAAAVLSPEELSHDFGTADKTIPGTFAHLYMADKNWLARLQQGTSASQSRKAEDHRFETVRQQWTETQQDWKRWVSQLPPEASGRIVEYLDLQGRPWANPLWQILLHVVNHATHHRGQVSGFIRALGKTPPPLDFIAFVRERSSETVRR